MTITPASICERVLEAVSETFETMIFTQVFPFQTARNERRTMEEEGGVSGIDSAGTESGEPLSKSYWTFIPVLSPVQGAMFMEIPSALAAEITKNLYGWMDESEMTEKVEQDALTELINTIAGRLMSLLLPEDRTFELGLPEIVDPSLYLSAGPVICRFVTGEEKFSFILTGELAKTGIQAED